MGVCFGVSILLGLGTVPGWKELTVMDEKCPRRVNSTLHPWSKAQGLVMAPKALRVPSPPSVPLCKPLLPPLSPTPGPCHLAFPVLAWLLILETSVTSSVTSLTHFLLNLCSVSSAAEIFPGRFQRDFLVGAHPANSVTLENDLEAGNCRDQRGCAGQWYGSLEEGREPVCRGEDLTFL